MVHKSFVVAKTLHTMSIRVRHLENEGVNWAKKILEKSPTAIRFLKNTFIAETDGLAGLQNMAGDITMMYYMTDEAKEGKNAFIEKRKPDFSKFPKPPFHG